MYGWREEQAERRRAEGNMWKSQAQKSKELVQPGIKVRFKDSLIGRVEVEVSSIGSTGFGGTVTSYGPTRTIYHVFNFGDTYGMEIIPPAPPEPIK